MNISEIKFDVTDTLGRVACSLLYRGIRIEAGVTASTDGRSVITIPHAMRKSLTASEMELVRFMLAHETSHIKHSDMAQADQVARACYHLVGFDPTKAVVWLVIQFLEDLRVNQRHAASYPGGAATVQHGNAVVVREWLDDKEQGGERSWEQALGEVLYLGHYYPEFRRAENNPCTKSRHISSCLAGVLDKIDREVPYLLETAALQPYVLSVIDLLSLDKEGGCPEAEEGEGEGEGEGVGEDLTEQIGEEYDREGFSSSSRPSSCGKWGDGVVERVVEDKLTTKNAREQVDMTEVSKTTSGSRFVPHMDTPKVTNTTPNAADSLNNYRRGMALAGGMTDYINMLKGMSRCGFGTPKNSGVRINRRRVPAFIQGLTDKVLSKRVKKKRRGTACVFLVDDSGSMRGAESRTAWISAATFAVACERAQISVAIVRYSSTVMLEKPFNTPSKSIAKRFGGCLFNSTQLDEAIDVAMFLLAPRKEERKVIFALTDGLTGNMASEIEDAEKQGCEVIPILFGPAAVRGKQNFRGSRPVLIPDTTKPIASQMVRALIARG